MTLLLIALPLVAHAGSPRSDAQVRTLYQSGMADIQLGKIEQAIAIFETALRSTPHDKVLLNAAGGAYSLQGDLKKACSRYRESLRVDPGFDPARKNLAIALYSLGRFDEADAELRVIEARSVRADPSVCLFLGLIAEKRCRCKSALSFLERSGELQNKYPDALLATAECQLRTGNRDRAAQALAEFDDVGDKSPSQVKRSNEIRAALVGGKLRPDNAQTSISSEIARAESFERLNKFAEAQEILERLAAERPTGDSLLDLARLAADRGDLDTAFKSLKRAAEVEPNRGESYLQFSTICADHGNDVLALRAAEIGLSHLPHSYALTVQKGVELAKTGQTTEAVATLQAATNMQFDNRVALASLAAVYAQLGENEAAAKVMVGAIRKYPGDYYLRYLQGKNILQESGVQGPSLDVAQQSLEESIRLNPHYADAYYQLSKIYLSKAPRLAKQALEKCLEVDPRHLPAQYSLAQLYFRDGQKSKGQALLARFKTERKAKQLQEAKKPFIQAAED